MIPEMLILQKFIMFGGSAFLGSEVLCMWLKNKAHKPQEIATGKLGNINSLRGITGKEGLRISKRIKLSKRASMEHILVVGSSGSHKTTSLFYPNLLTEDLGECSLVISDPKGELFRDTANYQRSIGREPILFSPLSPLNSFKYNLLEQCKYNTEIVELGQCILVNGAKALELSTGAKSGGIEWINMSLPLFVAALMYCKSKGRPMNTISNALKLIISHSNEELNLLLSNAGEDIKEQYSIFKMSMESPKTMSSIKTTLATNLQLFLDKNIIEATKETEFTAEDLRNKPITLYINYLEQKANYLSPFTSVFYSQIIAHLMQKQGLDVYILLDEFINIGVLNNFTSTIATARSRGIGFLICLQSISQLNNLYGESNAQSILNNLKTKCILPGTSDMRTLNYASELTGETEIETKSTSKSENNTTTSYGTTKKRLFNADEIRQLGDNEILIIAHNKQVVKDMQNLYFENEKYSQYVYAEELPFR